MSLFVYDFTTGTPGTTPLPNPPDLQSHGEYVSVGGTVYASNKDDTTAMALVNPVDGSNAIHQAAGVARFLGDVAVEAIGALGGLGLFDAAFSTAISLISLNNNGSDNTTINVLDGTTSSVLGTFPTNTDVSWDLSVSGSTVTGHWAGIAFTAPALTFTPAVVVFSSYGSPNSPSGWTLAAKNMTVATGSSVIAPPAITILSPTAGSSHAAGSSGMNPLTVTGTAPKAAAGQLGVVTLPGIGQSYPFVVQRDGTWSVNTQIDPVPGTWDITVTIFEVGTVSESFTVTGTVLANTLYLA